MTTFCRACGSPCLQGEQTVVDGVLVCPKCAGDQYNGRMDDERRKMAAHLRSTYSMPIEQYDMLFADQGGRCAICEGRPKGDRHYRLAVDHDHVTGEVRGLLCHGCNVALGWMRDDPDRLRRAAGYLEAPPAAEFRARLLQQAQAGATLVPDQ